ncbi:hypothetical protein NUW58_g4645 [Xylaria curta]|uniref:Uncharacterized protein n=1 Tax=Xylaria curta TaxID=42375 RepID=A0ACC1P5H0_9PEZI|nr:hypothetical protein NUW58_g4645 [Xylaria curta]
MSSTAKRSASRHRVRPKIWTRSFDNAEQFDCAARIFARLPIIPGLSCPSPRLCGQNRSRLEMQRECPTYGLWKAVDMIHKICPPYVPRMYVQDVRQLRDTLLNDTSILCASQIALNVDVTVLYVARKSATKRRPGVYVPFLENFDLGMLKSQDGFESDWAQHERDLVQKVKKQFDVLELLSQLASSPESQQQNHNNIDLDPETVVHILKATRPSPDMLDLVICRVQKYAPMLAEYVVEHAVLQLYALGKRREPLESERTRHHCNTVRHLVKLGPSDEDAQQQAHLLAGRATLLILYAALLIHLHSNIITVHDSKGLLQLDDPNDSPGAYASHENFLSVTQARCEARKAVRDLYAMGGKLPRDIRWFLSDNPVAD